jgi:hypothetical protein
MNTMPTTPTAADANRAMEPGLLVAIGAGTLVI